MDIGGGKRVLYLILYFGGGEGGLGEKGGDFFYILICIREVCTLISHMIHVNSTRL